MVLATAKARSEKVVPLRDGVATLWLMDPRTMASLLSLGRALFGAGLLLAPKRAGRGWIGVQSGEPVPQLLVRTVGARDVAVGMGAVMALRRGAPARGWLEAALLADLLDAAIALVYLRKLPLTGAAGTLMLTAMAGYAGIRLAPRVDHAVPGGNQRHATCHA